MSDSRGAMTTGPGPRIPPCPLSREPSYRSPIAEPRRARNRGPLCTQPPPCSPRRHVSSALGADPEGQWARRAALPWAWPQGLAILLQGPQHQVEQAQGLGWHVCHWGPLPALPPPCLRSPASSPFLPHLWIFYFPLLFLFFPSSLRTYQCNHSLSCVTCKQTLKGMVSWDTQFLPA